MPGWWHDPGMLPVTPYSAWRFRARKKVWRWGRSCGLGYCRLRARRSDSVSSRAAPRAAGSCRFPGKARRRCPRGRRTRRTTTVGTALMDHLRCEGTQRLVLESTSDYWRIFYYLAEAAGLEVWLASARDVKHLPGRGKSDRLDCVWHCKLNERGMLMRSFVPPEPVRDLRALTRTRARLAQDQTRHQSRVEKILEDALVKVSAVISDLFGTSGRRFPGALVAGQRSPKALAALGDYRLKASTAGLEAALTGRFRDIHASEIAVHLRLIDAINAEIALLDEQIEQQLASIPGVAPACGDCGL